MRLEKEAHITSVGREIAVYDWPANCSTLYGDCSEGDGRKKCEWIQKQALVYVLMYRY